MSGVKRDLDRAKVAVPAGTRTVLLQNEVPEAVNLAMAAWAYGARVILNAAPARAVSTDLLALVDVLVVNRAEAVALAGTDDPDAAATRLRAQVPGKVIVTLGPDGLVAAWDEGVARMKAPRVAVASTHGAGDAFTGTLAAELARGASFPQALQFAQGAAALAVATGPDQRDRLTERKVREFVLAL